MTDFTLRQLVREVLRTTTMTDPTSIAVEVDRRIDDADCRIALRQALRGYVREEITRLRMHPPAEEPRPAVATVMPLAAGAGTAAATRKPARSAKVTGIRDWWSARLSERTHVGGSEYLRLGDCSFENLMFAAAERREHAARNSARADWYEQLAEAVAAAGVQRVRDLSAEVLQVRLGDVAA